MRMTYHDIRAMEQRQYEFKKAVELLQVSEKTLEATYPANQVWAASWAAYRLNNYTYVRSDVENIDRDKVLNRALMFRILEQPVYLTLEDWNMGREMREFNTRLTLTALTRQLNSFEQMVAEAVLRDEIKKGKDFSVISCLPGNFSRELDRRKKVDELVKLIEGKHVGKPGDRIVMDDVMVIYSRLNDKYLRYFNMGNYKGNLVAWWSDTGFDLYSKHNLTCKIKDHAVWNSENGPIPMTKLNYVRVG